MIQKQSNLFRMFRETICGTDIYMVEEAIVNHNNKNVIERWLRISPLFRTANNASIWLTQLKDGITKRIKL